jgi:hypothetical protein
MLNAVDYCTSWAISMPCADQSAPSVIEMYKRIRDAHGPPLEIVTDRGLQFRSPALEQLLRHDGVKLCHTTPYHPNSNGKVERFNGQIKAILSSICGPTASATQGTSNAPWTRVCWENALPRAMQRYLSTPMVSGFTPYFLAFGTEPPQSHRSDHAGYTREPTPQEEQTLANERAFQVRTLDNERCAINSARFARDKVRSLLQEKKALLRHFAVGDWVLRRRERQHKLEPFYDGPHQVVECGENNTYRIRTLNGYELSARVSGARLFPAYVFDGHPLESMWYGSERLLSQDRERFAARARLALRM